MLTVFGSLRPLASFVAVAENGSFTAAARELGVTKAGVSKHIADLESQLGVQLLHRTTRTMRLTEAGKSVLDHGVRMLAEARAAHAVVAPHQELVTGHLKVTAPIGIGQRYVADALQSFGARHPKLTAELVLDDRTVDIVEGGYDVAVRAGRLADSSLRCRRLAELSLVVCAAPAYLARAREPTAPADLTGMDWLEYSPLGSPQVLQFERDRKRSRVRLSGRLRTNDGEVLRKWLLDGAGVSLLPRFWIERNLAERRLEPLLKKYKLRAGSVYAIHPHGTRPPKKLSEFIAHLVSAFGA